MTAPGYALFDTAIGRCGLAWNAAGVVCAAQLPEPRLDLARSRLQRRCGGVEAEPPAAIRALMSRIARLLSGADDDLCDVPLDLEAVPEFHRAVYAAARGIPPGRTLTYGELAARLNAPGAARAVGQALGANPIPIIVPCHRVLAAGGDGGFSAPGGVATKRRLLELEGLRLDGGQLGLF